MKRVLSTAVLSAVLLAMLLPLGCSRGERTTIEVFRILPNGITVAVKENHGSDVVAMQLFVRDGALFESPQEAGIANLVREMMFEETETRGVGEIEGTVARLGGTVSSACRHDFVQYAAVVPSSQFETVLDIMRDGLTGPVFGAENLERSRTAVEKSISAMKSRPVDRAYRMCLAEMMGDHPYGRLAEGRMEIVEKLTLEDVERHFNEIYRGSNLLVAVSGDIDAIEAAERVARVVSDIEKAPPAEPASPPVTWPTESSKVVEHADVMKACQVIGFPGPGVRDRDSIAMDVLLVILMEGRSSRLNVRLKEELGLVHSVGAGWYTQHHPSPLFVWMELPEENIEAAEQAVVELFREFASEPVSEEELAKAKILLETGNLRMVETAEGLAFHLGYWNSIGGQEFASGYLAGLSGVTGDEVRQAAALYLDAGVHVSAVVLPQ
jgi:zinc protease